MLFRKVSAYIHQQSLVRKRDCIHEQGTRGALKGKGLGPDRGAAPTTVPR